MPPQPRGRGLTLPEWAPRLALALSLALAWANFLLTSKWADMPGALHGARKPWYALALLAATALAALSWRRVGAAVSMGRGPSAILLLAGGGVLLFGVLSRLPPSEWSQIPFKDDWTPLFQAAVNGVHLMRRGAVVGWNWWLMGGYPTSTDIAQSFAALAFVPMALFGETVGYHVLHVILFLAFPVFVWWDLRHDDRELGTIAAGLAAFFAAGYLGPLGTSGDTNSLVGAFCAGLALVGSRAARMGRRWGGPVLMLGLTLALYSHVAFFVYASIYLVVEAAYFRDLRAAIRLVLAAGVAGIVALPVHWESLLYPAYVSFNNVTYDPRAPIDWPGAARSLYYNVEMLALPHRWFNHYPSLLYIWLPVVAVTALGRGRSRAGFYAWISIVTLVLLRLNTPQAGALFDRIQHMYPMLLAPALAAFIVRHAGTRGLALALAAVLGVFVQIPIERIRHVPDLRAFDPPLVDRIAAADGNMVLVEISPHRDMDADPERRSPKTPFDVHFEGLLPRVAGQRFYSQMIDGYVWNVWRGNIVGAGTFRGQAIDRTPPDAFVTEMKRWGVRHLFVWTDASRDYLARSGHFAERWRGALWSHFEALEPDVRSAVTSEGSARLRNLDFLGGEVEIENAVAGTPIVLRANYYPAWRAFAGDRAVALYSRDGQLAFDAPQSGSYVVRLEYPRYRAISLMALAALLFGGAALTRWPRAA